MINTVTLETAKTLKEAGFPQEVIAGDWYWVITSMGKVRHLLQDDNEDNISTTPFKWYKSPSTDEILEKLPDEVSEENGWYYGLIIEKIGKEYYISYLNEDTLFTADIFKNESFPEALAQMYLYLVSNKLLEGK